MNTTYLIDTNFILRFLLDDSPIQAKDAKEILLDAIKNEVLIECPIIVIFEMDWVLDTIYELPKTQRIDLIVTLIMDLPVHIEKKDVLFFAVETIYKCHNIDIEDAYIISYALNKKVKNILSFDKDLLKIFNEYVDIEEDQDD